MLPTKGYFQDIECPYYNSQCGRPYCHFRHRKKPTENLDDGISEKEVTAVPTYKPTPKSELANIQNNKSHIPISYVPDFTSERKSRPPLKFDKPTYNPTPISILSSASRRRISGENGENIEAIKEIKQNIANVEYNPAVSLQPTKDIDFEDLSSEFDLIDEIISSSEKTEKLSSANSKIHASDNSIKTNSDDNIKVPKEGEKCENRPDTTKENVKLNQKEDKPSPIKVNTEKSDKQVKHSETTNVKQEKNEKSLKEKDNGKNDKPKRSSKHESSSKQGKSEKSRKEKDKHSDKHDKHKHSNKSNSSSKEKSDSNKERTKSSSDKSHKSSRKDQHRNEEKKEDKHSHHKNKRKSKDRSRSRSKEKTHKSFEKEKARKSEEQKSDRHKKPDKGQHKSKSNHKHKEKSSKEIGEVKEEKSENYMDYSSNESDNNLSAGIIENNLSDIDFDDEDETMLECYKIFNEYKPPKLPICTSQTEATETETVVPQSSNDNSDLFLGKKRIAHANVENTTTYSQLHPPIKPKPVNAPGQTLANRYKIAKLAQANREQEYIMNEVKQPSITPIPIKRPAPTLLEAAREHKLRRQQQKAEATCLVDDILKGATKLNSTQPKMTVKKIAPAQNVKLMEKAKERILKIKQSAPQIKTIAQTQKTGRIAHVPEKSLSDIPDVLHADKSKLPVNVRTRFLTMIADECVKLYVSKDEAFTRALNEEFSCYEKCKVLVTYRNSAMLAVNRLRKEVQERDRLGLGLIGLGESSSKDSSSEFKGRGFYDKVKSWILTEEELDIHGYPRESEEHHGRAVIKNRKSVVCSNLDDNQKTCSRCHKIYQVDDDGWPLFEEECLYHPLKKRTIRGEQTYLCCRSSEDTGCASSDSHVSDGNDDGELEGFQKTMDPEREDDPRSYTVYALDCEMCYTTKGLELTRVTIVDTDCKTVYESLVKPLNPIIDYNTRFSGITKEQMDKTSTSILQIQANILHLCNSRTILVGHSLESDMKALKIVHGTVIDTSVLFPHKMGLPHKRALKALASEYLRKIIQNDISGHDSAEDAITCMELIKWKLKDELKARGSK